MKKNKQLSLFEEEGVVPIEAEEKGEKPQRGYNIMGLPHTKLW